MNIGKKIKEYRKKMGLTQKELAEKINKSEVTIRKYETGQREPKMDVIQEICTALNVSMSDFGKELFQDYDSINLIEETKEIELIEQLLKLYGYKIKNVYPGAATEEEAEELANDPTVPCFDVTNSDNENITLTISDWNSLTANLKKFFDFELFKLK